MKPIDKLSEEEWRALAAQAVAMPDAPAHVVQRALELWHRYGIVAPVPLLQRWAAVLTFDSWAAPAVAAGVRALRSETRQLVFAANGVDIDVRVMPRDEGFSLCGQLLGPVTEGFVELVTSTGGSAAPAARRVALDALGEFLIDGLAEGTYAITVRLGNDAIELPPVHVGAR